MSAEDTVLVLDIVPCPKPRMTQRDKWKQRPAVVRYRAYKDAVRILTQGRPFPTSGATVEFYLPLPASWSKKRRNAMEGQPHQQKPDLDNLLKGLWDAMMVEDAMIWDLTGVRKLWASSPCIKIYFRDS